MKKVKITVDNINGIEINDFDLLKNKLSVIDSAIPNKLVLKNFEAIVFYDGNKPATENKFTGYTDPLLGRCYVHVDNLKGQDYAFAQIYETVTINGRSFIPCQDGLDDRRLHRVEFCGINKRVTTLIIAKMRKVKMQYTLTFE